MIAVNFIHRLLDTKFGQMSLYGPFKNQKQGRYILYLLYTLPRLRRHSLGLGLCPVESGAPGVEGAVAARVAGHPAAVGRTVAPRRRGRLALRRHLAHERAPLQRAVAVLPQPTGRQQRGARVARRPPLLARVPVDERGGRRPRLGPLHHTVTLSDRRQKRR